MWCGVVWYHVVWYNVVWCGVVWCGVAWCGVVTVCVGGGGGSGGWVACVVVVMMVMVVVGQYLEFRSITARRVHCTPCSGDEPTAAVGRGCMVLRSAVS